MEFVPSGQAVLALHVSCTSMLVIFVALERFNTRIPRSIAGGSPTGFLNLPVASPARKNTTDSARRISTEVFMINCERIGILNSYCDPV